MIEIDGTIYMTENQWNKKKRAILKRQREKGILREWTHYRKRESAMFYCESQTRPYNQKELKKLKQERKLAREAKKEKERRLLIEYEENIEHTAWQWLSYWHRIPKDYAVPTKNYSWYYYKKKDTVEVEDSIFEILKAMYIKKFGGWETIDLENTEYDGHKWW